MTVPATASPHPAAVAEIALATPLPQLDRPLEYTVPVALRARIGVGMRVRAPLRTGGRVVDGFVLALREQATFDGKLAEIVDLVSEAPVLAPSVARLARLIADRQAGTLADVLRLAVPTRSARVEDAWLAAREERARRDPTRPGPPNIDASSLTEHYGDAAAERLLAEGVRIALSVPDGVQDGIPKALLVLTEIAARRVLAGGRVVVAVPDFRDVALVEQALVGMGFPDDLLHRLDAKLKPSKRYAAFLRCLETGPALMLGTRSAVLGPADPLDAIIMWDDGDDSFIEPMAPGAHARDVALVRQRETNCALVLAARTPSAEVVRLVELGWCEAIEPRRRRRSRVIVTDQVMGDDPAQRAARIPSYAWQVAAEAASQGPVLMQVARAGYARGLACVTCRTPATCASCGGPLSIGRSDGIPTCRLCGRPAHGRVCPECGDLRLRMIGIGAERTAEELGRAFPGRTIHLATGDDTVLDVPQRPAIVVATRGAEPIAPEGYEAVILLDADAMLAREGLDVGIQTLRGWSTAAALVRDGGQVVLTGALHDAAKALRDADDRGFVARELAARRALGFPPAVRGARLTGQSDELRRAVAELQDAVPSVRCLGPVSGEDGGAGRSASATLLVPWGESDALAAACKRVMIREATRRGPRTAGRAARASTLRVRFDPAGLLDDTPG